MEKEIILESKPIDSDRHAPLNIPLRTVESLFPDRSPIEVDTLGIGEPLYYCKWHADPKPVNTLLTSSSTSSS